MLSYELIYADANVGSKTALGSQGLTPVDGTVCPGFTLPSRVITRAAIYADETRVYGIRLLTTEGTADLGILRGTPVLQTFTPNAQFVGMYGTYFEGGFITSLGFLTYDPECTAGPVIQAETKDPNSLNDKPTVTVTDQSADVAEEGMDITLIIGVIVGVVLLGLLALCLYCLCKKKS